MEYTRDYFNRYVERKGTRSIKWDGCNAKFGVDESVEMIPMWIADMDFQAPKEVIDAVKKKAAEGIYGYSTKPDSFYEAIMSWVSRRYHWEVKKEWIIFTPGVIPGFTIAIQNFTEPGDGIIIQTPVYYPFMDGIRNNERRMVENVLKEENGYYTIDFEDLEEKAKDPRNKLMILSNPHNPVGRAWTREELERLGNICADNGVVLVSDEIHADLMMKGVHHQAVCSISEKIKNNTITNYAPSKTFNLAGLQTAYTIIPNDEMRKAFVTGLNANRIFNMNWFGPVAMEAAYNESGNYVEALNEYLDDNMNYMKKYLEENLPMLHMQKPEATYLVWVDFRDTGMNTEQIEHFIAHKAHIGVDMGSWFGSGGDGFLRFNVACPRFILEQAMEQLKRSIEEIQ
ncbi:MalY/PatB family protein [Clostridium sp. AM58-1XD]|uniref:MalY/PatB family protein n=1 Tax=Clostridium sp. AM58-1XD TaxID=2292307 RepID=UPI000E5302B3|nr:MalY/PatB family protein [Clostridium sp. AM58-1XD]RGY97142.1 pyridoxal phosphate-dependent aminotransferase [Clostridium sp. AM58-1XD]